MAIPTYEDLMLPLLQEYAAAARPMSIKDLLPVMANKLGLSDQDLAERLPSGRQSLFHNRLHWAKTYMARAGLLSSPARGQAQITQVGTGLLAENPARIDGGTLSRNPEFVAWKTSSASGRSPAPEAEQLGPVREASEWTPEERIEAARADLEKGLRAELLERVRSMTPAEFEELIVQLLLRMGYGTGAAEMARALGGSGDRGIDGVVHQDPLGLDRVYIQAKRYADGNTVGSREIRDFNGALDLVRAPKGLFVTASTFTKDAVHQAQNATRQIVLIDGNEFAALMLKYKVGTRVLGIVEIQALDEGFFSA
ncbi:restriction endonuclease [Croceibacterium ferulae]|uniref:restriction endonuclease n=1 Tax=Croceibacterium ferulae TaxID=1854641 RepID=UPI000EAE9289|nr:restriction endonuclease [Croceibacterium ferulae]